MPERGARAGTSPYPAMALVGTVLLASHLHNLLIKPGMAGIQITPADLVILGIGLLVAREFMRTGSVELSRPEVAVLVFIGLFTAWHVLRFPPTDQPIRGITLVLLLLRDGVLVLGVFAFIRRVDLDHVNRTVFVLTAAIAGVVLLAYVVAVAAGPDPPAVVDWLVYVDDNGILRLEGLQSGPNFLAFNLLLGYLCGFYEFTRNAYRTVDVPMLAVIVIALFMTVSRSVLVLVVAITAFVVVRSVSSDSNRRLPGRDTAKVFGFLLFFAVLLLVMIGPELLIRFSPGEFPRLNLWQRLVNRGEWRYLVGAGLRGTEVVLGRYAHNSYLALFFNLGLVGTGMYLALAIYLTLGGIRRVTVGGLGAARPWLWAWLGLLVFQFFFTFTYRPIAWLVVGLYTVGISVPLPGGDHSDDTGRDESFLSADEPVSSN